MAVRRVKNNEKFHSGVFLPDHLDELESLARMGVSDKEMAKLCGLKEKTIEKWRNLYPQFNCTLERGRAQMDAEVVQALFELATGYNHPETKVHFDKDGNASSFEVTKHYVPDLDSIKLWLNNRQKTDWQDAKHIQLTGKKDEPDLMGIRDETKQELMSSILSLIPSKPDPVD